MRAVMCASIALVIHVTAAPACFAQSVSTSVSRGEKLAAQLCANCHVIDRAPAAVVPTDVPSFPVIANRAGTTSEHLTGKIIIPHPAMPSVPLTANEIQDLVAYIMTLKHDRQQR